MKARLVLHTVTPRYTFDQNLIDFFSKVPEIWNRQEIQGVP